MIVLLTAVMLAQPAACIGAAPALAGARERAAALDPDGARARLEQAPAGCADAQAALWFLRGLAAAREAYRVGGSPESLEPVKRAMEEVRAYVGRVETAGVAIALLQAAAAAAQSEREEMALLLDHAQQLERRLSETASLILGVAEVAGDLWLQVHRFDDARRAYAEAVRLRGPSARVALGLARVAVRLNEVPAACAAYRDLLAMRVKEAEAPEDAEARSFLRRPDCNAGTVRP
jgi:cytochrome c-type biogenesis protein CcmH/NrfG